MTLSLSYDFILAIGLSSLLLYVIKLFLLLLGGDSSDSFENFSSDLGDVDAQASFSLFSTQSLLAFVMGMSWSLLAAHHEWHLSPVFAWITSLFFGFVMMFLSAFLLSKIKGLNTQGSFNIHNALGKTGLVYLTIPPKGKGLGQVEIVVDGRRKVLKAMSLEEASIKSFQRVEIIKVENNILIVKTL